MSKIRINYKQINPNGFQLLHYALKDTIRFIILFGGSSSGKSYSVAQVILILTILDGENTLVFRKIGASVARSTYEDFRVACRQLGMNALFKFQQNTIKCLYNGAKIDFGGLDDPEKVKGISNYKRVCLEEVTEFDEADLKQIRKRLRGKKGQKIIATFNPISETHWLKKNFLDKQKFVDVPMQISIFGEKLPVEITTVKSVKMNEAKEMLNPRTHEIETHDPDFVVIQSTYLNNFWVVGSPDGTYGFYDEQCVADFDKDKREDPDYYNVYALGEWGVIRTGSEFLASFNRGKHAIEEYTYNPDYPIHISVDSNVLPYITCTYYQCITENGGKEIREILETCAENPNNTARKSAQLVADKLKELKYSGKLYVHGDASTKAANNIDDEKRSFMDLFISVLQANNLEVVDVVGNKNPSVAMTGEFINAIFEGTIDGISVGIDSRCVNSIEDYQSVQKDVNGAILKTKVKNKTTMQTYEEHGHITDTLRYFVHDCCREEFIKFANRRKRNIYARDGVIHYYNPSTSNRYSKSFVYLMPNKSNFFVLMHGSKCGDKWHIDELIFHETSSVEEITQKLSSYPKDTTIVIECSEAYYSYVRELREKVKLDIRVAPESNDIDRRIAATSDYMSQLLLFNEQKLAEEEEYSDFMTNLLDYNVEAANKGASAVVSGFIQYVIKTFPNG